MVSTLPVPLCLVVVAAKRVMSTLQLVMMIWMPAKRLLALPEEVRFQREARDRQRTLTVATCHYLAPLPLRRV